MRCVGIVRCLRPEMTMNSRSVSLPNVQQDLGVTAPYWDRFSYDTSGNLTRRVQRTGSGSSTSTTALTSLYPGPPAAHPHQVAVSPAQEPRRALNRSGSHGLRTGLATFGKTELAFTARLFSGPAVIAFTVAEYAIDPWPTDVVVTTEPFFGTSWSPDA